MRDDHRKCCDLLFKVRRARATLRALRYLVDGPRGVVDGDGFAVLARLVQMEQAAEILEARLINQMRAPCVRNQTDAVSSRP